MHWVWITPFVLLIIYLASPRFRGDIAQTRVRRILAAGLEKNRYTILNDVILPSGGGTLHIDHLVVSRFGLFVIKSQYARGLVSGGEFQQSWKQTRFGRPSSFDNPVHRSRVQAEALERLLNIPSSKLRPIAVMVGHSGFKSAPPANLLSPEKLVSHLRKQTHQLLDAEQAERLLKTIEDLRIGRHGRLSFGQPRFLIPALMVILVAGAYLAFRDDIADFQSRLAPKEKPGLSEGLDEPDQDRKSELEQWQASLVCAWSSDTGRCFCYEPDGSKADVDTRQCRTLAERGSVLKQ